MSRHTSTSSEPPPASGYMTDDQDFTRSTVSETASYTSRGSRLARGLDIDQEFVLRTINSFRSQHGSPPLKWSEVCASRAQKRANHSRVESTDEFGENLSRSTDARWLDASLACIASIRHWQKEETRYHFDKPGLSANTDHFTNNVWKLTTHVGFGVGRARYKGRTTFFVVACFHPKGNQPGDFRRNVLPKGSIYDGDVYMTRHAHTDEHGTLTTPPPHVVRATTVNTEVRHLRSPDGRYHFQILPDRNIVVRAREELVWQSGSKSRHRPPGDAPFRLVLQRNGDLVGYDAVSRVFWSSGTAECGPAPYTLSMRDDGHCVLYDGDWKARWATSFGSH